MQAEEYQFIEAALLHAEAGVVELRGLLLDLARHGHIVWPPDW